MLKPVNFLSLPVQGVDGVVDSDLVDSGEVPRRW